jgi:hypothetical protein
MIEGEKKERTDGTGIREGGQMTAVGIEVLQ